MEDFSEAVRQMPSYGDGWKRRGQARAALEQHEEALEVRRAFSLASYMAYAISSPHCEPEQPRDMTLPQHDQSSRMGLSY